MRATWTAALALALTTLACGGLLEKSPEGVVETYLQAASDGDEETVQGLVEERCRDTKIGRGGPAMVMGVPIQIEELEVELVEESESEAEVRYTFSGVLDHQGGEISADVLGSKVEVTTGPVKMDIDENTGTLDLVYTQDGWRITCLGILGL